MDLRRRERGEPVLLPEGFRLHNADPDYDPMGAWPVEAHEQGRVFTFEGETYQYVPLDTFIREYELPERYDQREHRLSISDDFLAAVGLFFRGAGAKPKVILKLVVAIRNCILTDPVSACLRTFDPSKSPLPAPFKEVLSRLEDIKPEAVSNVERWFHKLIQDWNQSPLRPAVRFEQSRLSDTVFEQIILELAKKKVAISDQEPGALALPTRGRGPFPSAKLDAALYAKWRKEHDDEKKTAVQFVRENKAEIEAIFDANEDARFKDSSDPFKYMKAYRQIMDRARPRRKCEKER